MCAVRCAARAREHSRHRAGPLVEGWSLPLGILVTSAEAHVPPGDQRQHFATLSESRRAGKAAASNGACFSEVERRGAAGRPGEARRGAGDG